VLSTLRNGTFFTEVFRRHNFYDTERYMMGTLCVGMFRSTSFLCSIVLIPFLDDAELTRLIKYEEASVYKGNGSPPFFNVAMSCHTYRSKCPLDFFLSANPFILRETVSNVLGFQGVADTRVSG
jgi:hypothetical protein